MNSTKLTKAVILSAKIISSLMAGFIIYMFTGDVIYSLRHPGSTHIQPLSIPEGRHDALMLGLMGLIVVGMLMVWWKEKAGAWLSIISVTAIVGCVWYLNDIPMYRLVAFLLATVPAIVLLMAPCQRRLQETSL